MVHMQFRFYLFLFSLLFSTNLLSGQGYEIRLNAPDFAGQEVILAEYFTNRMVPKDTARISIMGEALFSGKTAFEGGLYIMFFSPGYYFDFLLDKNQKFSVTTDSSDLAGKTTFDGSDENELFYAYKGYLTKQREIQKTYSEALNAAETGSDSSRIRKKMEDLNEEMADYIDRMISENSHSFFSTFLLATKEVHVPEEILRGTKREQDSIRYIYYKDHYFDHFDLSDIRLLHTPLYEPKVKTYINNVVPRHPDSLIVAVDKLMEKARSNADIFRYMLITLFNNFAESKVMGMDKVYFHIAEKYYIPEATWSSEEFIEKLSENLEKSKPTFIGNVAPDFELKGIPRDHFQLAEMDTAIKSDPHIGYNFMLSQIPAEYTMLYFWEADCGHCKKSTPALYKVFMKYKDQDVQALAVHVINSVEGKIKWVDFVNEYGTLEWINCWSPYDNEFRKLYNLQSFPQLFLLDKDKKIVAKSLSTEQVDDILSRLLND
ncbi:MAG: thioredoxin-like domain-containing protein [Bacteroidales bacterium]